MDPEPVVVSAPKNPEPAVALAAFEEAAPRPAAAAADDNLILAAGCIEKGDPAGAAEHLKRHVRAHPDQLMIRVYLAELLLKLSRLPDAQFHFEQFLADAQESAGPAREKILHCHTRLMEIAQRRDDAYGEHLHRGIGFVLLARQFDNVPADDAQVGFRERLLCKASVELSAARKLRCDEPRPCWYLTEVWNKLHQPRSAEKALRSAKTLAALLPLPPAEQRALAVAAAAQDLRDSRP
jgi:hypothetical protein